MLRKSTDSLVIKPRLSAPARLAISLVAIAIVAGASVAGYWGGHAAVYQQLESRAQEIASLKAALRESRALRRAREAEAEASQERSAAELRATRQALKAELATARDRLAETRQRLEDTKSSLAKVTRQLQVDQTAYKELREQLEASNRRITELASELKFYRSIISPADGRSGVRIQELDIQPADAAREYRYRLILIQALEHEDSVQGDIWFEIRGTAAGESRTIRAPSESQGRIAADFRYFQNFVGTFALPVDFIPAEVTVVFEADDAKVQRTYPWPELGGGTLDGGRRRAVAAPPAQGQRKWTTISLMSVNPPKQNEETRHARQ